jgi:signal transduction histidine kinase
VLGGLRVLLSGVLRRGEPARYESGMGEAVEGIERGTSGLRAIISGLRPAALDEIGLKPALETLLERHAQAGLEVQAYLDHPRRAPR